MILITVFVVDNPVILLDNNDGCYPLTVIVDSTNSQPPVSQTQGTHGLAQEMCNRMNNYTNTLEEQFTGWTVPFRGSITFSNSSVSPSISPSFDEFWINFTKQTGYEYKLLHKGEPYILIREIRSIPCIPFTEFCFRSEANFVDLNSNTLVEYSYTLGDSNIFRVKSETVNPIEIKRHTDSILVQSEKTAEVLRKTSKVIRISSR